MDFKISSRKIVEKFSRKRHNYKSIIISITDKKCNYPQISFNPQFNGIQEVCFLKFNDVSKVQPNFITRKDAQKIVAFVKKYEKSDIDTIIVHCEVGVSRSAGICAAILKYFNRDPRLIFSNPKYKPNIGCYEMVCESFGLKPSKKELSELQRLHNDVWNDKTWTEKIEFCVRALQSSNLSHFSRQIKIRKSKY